MTRSASMTPSSMSRASSEASLTLCSGTLRTSIGAGTASSSRGVWSGGAENGADVVALDGVGDVLERGDHGAGAATLDEAERRLDLGTHRAARELAVGGVRAQLGNGHPAQRAGGRRAE